MEKLIIDENCSITNKIAFEYMRYNQEEEDKYLEIGFLGVENNLRYIIKFLTIPVFFRMREFLGSVDYDYLFKNMDKNRIYVLSNSKLKQGFDNYSQLYHYVIVESQEDYCLDVITTKKPTLEVEK